MTSNPLTDFTIQMHAIRRPGDDTVWRFVVIGDTQSGRSIEDTKSMIDGIANYLVSIDERISDFNIIYKDVNNNWNCVLLEHGNFKSFEPITDVEHESEAEILLCALNKFESLAKE
ncbi:TPA: hypothetical protein ACGIK9_002889 [Acinetobacter baumannii]|uniref:hypothetical protein n=1 Tax=Acinetobacter baumannii TaxID=470 RepID=UPI00338D87BF